MFCPQCRTEYRDGFHRCSDCHVALVAGLPPVEAGTGDTDLDLLIRTGHRSPVAIALIQSLLEEAGIPFITMDQEVATRQEGGNFIGWWNFQVPRGREAEVREILRSVEEQPQAE